MSSECTGQFVHCVFFTVKPGTSAEAIDSQIADAKTYLATIPTVRKIDCGLREEAMQREVNDKEFLIGLSVFFDDKAGHDVYGDHPQHLEYIDRNKAIWQQVRVFDFIAK